MRQPFILAIASATLLGALSLANAQDAPTAKIAPSPGSVNASNKATTPSGSESQATRQAVLSA